METASTISTIRQELSDARRLQGLSPLSSTATTISSASNDCQMSSGNDNPDVIAKRKSISMTNTTDGHSTIDSTIIGPAQSRLRRRQRISILKKLREKLTNNDVNNEINGPSSVVPGDELRSTDSCPTTAPSSLSRFKNIIRIGVGNQGTTCSSRSSTLRSWRLVDDFFRGRLSTPSRQSTVSSCRSAFSNKTIIYDDKSLEISKPAFCTIVNVDSAAAGHTISASESNPSGQDRRQASMGQVQDRLTSQGVQFLDQTPLPFIGNSVAESASGSGATVQLVGWRLRPEFDTAVAVHLENGNSDSQNLCNDPFNSVNSLTADQLPRVYSGWPLPPTFRAMGARETEACDHPKGCCCSGNISHSLMIRIFIAVISLIGLSCVIVGIVLGALTVSGSTRLTLCLLMIGVGVVLMIVSGIAWRLTSLDPGVSLSCWNILGLRTFRSDQSFFPETRPGIPHYRGRNGRHGIPVFANLPSDFVWRPPPPTYQATVQEVRLQNIFSARLQNSATSPMTVPPPPTYRLNHCANQDTPQRPSLNDLINRTSRPPSYSGRTFERLNMPFSQNCDEIPGAVAANAYQQRVQSPLNINDLCHERSSTSEIRVPTTSHAVARTCTGHQNSMDDDKVSLLRSDHLARSSNAEHSFSRGDGASNNQAQDDTVSVIDCSEAVPIIVQGHERNNNDPINEGITTSSIDSTNFQSEPRINQRPESPGGTYAQDVPRFSPPFLPPFPSDIYRYFGPGPLMGTPHRIRHPTVPLRGWLGPLIAPPGGPGTATRMILFRPSMQQEYHPILEAGNRGSEIRPSFV